MSAPVRFAGYAAIFRKRDSGGDTILPGAFKGSLERRLAEGWMDGAGEMSESGLSCLPARLAQQFLAGRGQVAPEAQGIVVPAVERDPGHGLERIGMREEG